MKLDRKISTSSTKFCVSCRLENQYVCPGLWLAEKFSTFNLQPLNGTLQEDLNLFYQVCVSSWSENQYVRPGLWLAATFSTLNLQLGKRIQRNLTRSKISMSSTKFLFFQANGKAEMATLTSDWPRNFWLFLCKYWTEFKETSWESS